MEGGVKELRVEREERVMRWNDSITGAITRRVVMDERRSSVTSRNVSQYSISNCTVSNRSLCWGGSSIEDASCDSDVSTTRSSSVISSKQVAKYTYRQKKKVDLISHSAKVGG